MNETVAPAKPRRLCPICAGPAAGRYKPFCSKRCADIDLSRWLKAGYAIPAVEPPDDLSEAEED